MDILQAKEWGKFRIRSIVNVGNHFAAIIYPSRAVVLMR